MEEHLVQIRDYEKIRLLGSGCSSDVYLIEEKKTKARYAAKVIKSSNHSKKDKSKCRELWILCKMNVPTVIKFHGMSLYDTDIQTKPLSWITRKKDHYMNFFVMQQMALSSLIIPKSISYYVV